HSAVDRYRRWLPSVVRTLRPRDERYLRHSGRNLPGDCGRAQGEVNPAAEPADRPAADNQPCRPSILLGRALSFLAIDSGSLARGLECFQRSVALDPDYAAPHAGL